MLQYTYIYAAACLRMHFGQDWYGKREFPFIEIHRAVLIAGVKVPLLGTLSLLTCIGKC